MLFIAKIINRRLFVFVITSIVLLFPFFFLGGPTPYSTPLFCAAWNVGHIIFFGLLAVFFTQHCPDINFYKITLFLLFVFILGGGIEIIQHYTGRDANWLDILRDMTGALVGLCWVLRATFPVWLLRVVAFLLLLPDVFYVSGAAASQWYLTGIFPQLGNFESMIELHAWKGNIERDKNIYATGHNSLHIHLTTQRYSGASLNEFFHTWRGFNYLVFDIYNPQPEPLLLVIRVSDVEHLMGDNALNDRFNQPLNLVAGWNHIEIPVAVIELAPASRKMDLDHIESIMIFAVQLKQPRDIYLDNLHLK